MRRSNCSKPRRRGAARSGASSASIPDGGPVTVRDGRYGAYVNWGKVNATIPKGTAPDSITLSDALELIAEREGKPVARPRKAAKGAPARGKAQPAKAGAAESAKARGQIRRGEKSGRQKGRPSQAEIRRRQAVIKAKPGSSSRLAARRPRCCCRQDRGRRRRSNPDGIEALTRRPIVPSAGGQSRAVKGINIGARGGCEATCVPPLGFAPPPIQKNALSPCQIRHGRRRRSAPPSLPSRRRCRAA